MEITHIGHSCFKIRSKSAVLITDPFDPDAVGLAFPKTEADIITVSHSHEDHNFLERIINEPVVISGPGEYEIKGVRIMGISSYHDTLSGSDRGRNTIYHIVIDGISIVHLGDLGHKLDENTIETLDGVDIVMIPVGGTYTLDPTSASELITQFEPRIVIPMHYYASGLKSDTFGKLKTVADFLKEIGKVEVIPQPKLVTTKDKLPEEMEVVVLE